MNFYFIIESKFGQPTLISVLRPTDYPFRSLTDFGQPTLVSAFSTEFGQPTYYDFLADFNQSTFRPTSRQGGMPLHNISFVV